MSSLYLILLCCVGSWLMYLWFYSDFFAYYAKALKFIFPKKIYDWLLIEEFFTDTETQATSYIEFLYIKRSINNNFIISFFLKLFGCIICLTTWTALIISLVLGNILYIGLIFLILRVLDFILRFSNR
jgi:hypothetical protein